MSPTITAPSSAPTTPSKAPRIGDMTTTPRAHISRTPRTPRTPRRPQTDQFIMSERRKGGNNTDGSPTKNLIREMTLVEQSPNGKGTRIRVELVRPDAVVTPKKTVSRTGSPTKRLDSPLKDAAGHVSQGVDTSPSRTPASARQTGMRTGAPVSRAETALKDMHRETPRRTDGSPPKTLGSARKTTTLRTDMTIKSSASPLKGNARAIPRKTHTGGNLSNLPYRTTPVAVKCEKRAAEPKTPTVTTSAPPGAMNKTSAERTANISYTPVNSPSRPASPSKGRSPVKHVSPKTYPPTKEIAMDKVSTANGASFTPKTTPPMPLAMDDEHDGIAVRDFALMLDHPRLIADTRELSPDFLKPGGETDKLTTKIYPRLNKSPKRPSMVNRRTSSGTHSGTRSFMESEMDQMRAKMGHSAGSITHSSSSGSLRAVDRKMKEDIRTKLPKCNRSGQVNHTPTPPTKASKEAKAFSPGGRLPIKTIYARPLDGLVERKHLGFPRGLNAAVKTTAPAVPEQDHPATVARPRNPTPHAATGMHRQRSTFARTTRLNFFDLSLTETPKGVLSASLSSISGLLSTTTPGLRNVSQSSLRNSASPSTPMVPEKDSPAHGSPPHGSSPASDVIANTIHVDYRKPTSIDGPASQTRWPSKIPVHVMKTTDSTPNREDERFANAQDISNFIKDLNEDDRARAALLDNSPFPHSSTQLKEIPCDPKPAARASPPARMRGKKEYLFSSDFNKNIRVRDKKTTPSFLNVNVSLANEDKRSKKEVNVTPITAEAKHHYESPTMASMMRLTPAPVSSTSPQDPFLRQRTARLFPSPSQKLGVATEQKTVSPLTPKDVTMQMRLAGVTRNMMCTPSKKIGKSLAKAIDLKITEDVRAGKEFTASGNRVSELISKRVGRRNGK